YRERLVADCDVLQVVVDAEVVSAAKRGVVDIERAVAERPRITRRDTHVAEPVGIRPFGVVVGECVTARGAEAVVDAARRPILPAPATRRLPPARDRDGAERDRAPPAALVPLPHALRWTVSELSRQLGER